MTAARLRELADRVEAATGPDRELDALIAVELRCAYEGIPAAELEADEYGADWTVLVRIGERKHQRFAPPRYTASLDAAMTLVPDGWYRVEQQQTREGAWAKVTLLEKGFAPADEGHAAIPALALTAAALRARARAMEGE